MNYRMHCTGHGVLDDEKNNTTLMSGRKAEREERTGRTSGLEAKVMNPLTLDAESAMKAEDTDDCRGYDMCM